MQQQTHFQLLFYYVRFLLLVLHVYMCNGFPLLLMRQFTYIVSICKLIVYQKISHSECCKKITSTWSLVYHGMVPPPGSPQITTEIPLTVSKCRAYRQVYNIRLFTCRSVQKVDQYTLYNWQQQLPDSIRTYTCVAEKMNFSRTTQFWDYRKCKLK